MANDSTIAQLRGNCHAPFLDESKFSQDGFIAGRICSQSGNTYCCLPCPTTDWLYDDEFTVGYRAAESVNVASFVLCLILIISFIFLPVDKTRRHYLSYCLLIAVISLHLGFVIPLGAQPEQCYDEITPNDMYSSLTCAFSGAFIIAGGLGIIVWIFIRALSMHLQICWDLIPGKRFFYWAQGLGWGIIAVLFTITITITGVSFRFGDACHVNSAHSLGDFWGPLLAIAGLATLVQLATFAYCINVYLKNMFSDEKTETTSSGGLPSYAGSSLRNASARAVYRRVRKVVWLQWRGITIVVFILVDVIFFSVVFVYMNQAEQAIINDPTSVEDWILCLMDNPDNKEKCMSIGQAAIVNKSTVLAILIMLSLAGFQCFILLFRWSMVTGWIQFFKDKIVGQREFVSLDAKRFSSDGRAYELLKLQSASGMVKEPASAYSSPVTRDMTFDRSGTPDYFSKETQRAYRTPSNSFSTPRAPSQVTMRMDAMHVDWDPRSTHARGGLGLHPPIPEDYDQRENRI